MSFLSNFFGGSAANRTSTSSTSTTLSPELQALIQRLQGYSTQSMENPEAGFAPIKNAAVDQINRNYMDVPSRLSKQFASRGYGSSGSFGNSLYQTELARGGDLSNLEGQFAGKAIDQKNYGASLGQSLLNFGRTTSTTNVAAPGSIFGNTLKSLSSLLMLGGSLASGSGGGSGGGGGGGGEQMGPPQDPTQYLNGITS